VIGSGEVGVKGELVREVKLSIKLFSKLEIMGRNFGFKGSFLTHFPRGPRLFYPLRTTLLLKGG
jgi:hypothetical protein